MSVELRVRSSHLARPLDEPSGLVIVSVAGDEAISELFAFEVVVLAHPDIVTAVDNVGGFELALLQAEVAFCVGPEGHRRIGMINAVDVEGPFDFDERVFTRLRLSVVPRAWLLKHRKNSRIFQQQYVHEIVSAILGENGVRHRWDLQKSYPKRIYCTQYEETDYDFVRRLFAEEGILFYFETGEEAVVEIAGDQGAGDPIARGFTKALNITRDVAREVGGIAKATGDTNLEGVAGVVQGAAGMAGDLFRELENEEDDQPRVIGEGQGGPSAAGDVLVFTDVIDGYSIARDPAGTPLVLTLRDEASLVSATDQMDAFAPAFRTRPAHFEVSDYDFRRPLLELRARVGDERGDHDPGLPLEIYDHHGEYITEDVRDEGVQIQREQYRRDAATHKGRGRSARISAGHIFRLESHLTHGRGTTSEPGDYVVTRARHEFYSPHFAAGAGEGLARDCARAIHDALLSGRVPPEEEIRKMLAGGGKSPPRIYQNRFDAVAASIVYRPSRPARALRHVTETATVMGPEGQEIFADRYGRVKVQFHWDREGRFNEKSSCWLRVCQPWAGAGFGFQFFPRVGMEVLVTFLGGDTDHPVVIGALYNGTHVTPEQLPMRMTRSGIRTQTSPQGGGFNELSFEDARDKERVYLHGQRNFEVKVNHDVDFTIGNRWRTVVGGDSQHGVGGDQRFTVGKNLSSSVGGNASSFVKGSQQSRVLTNQLQMVQGNNNLVVGGANIRRVNESDLTAVRGFYNVTARSGASFMVTGSVDASTSMTGYVKGSAYLTASERIVARTQRGEDGNSIRLECGTSIIEMLPDRISIVADEIAVRGRNRTDIVGSTSVMSMRQNGTKLEAHKIVLVQRDGKAALGLFEDGIAQMWGEQHADLIAETGVIVSSAGDLKLHGNEIAFAHPNIMGTPPRLQPFGSPDPQQQQPPNVTLRFTHLATDHADPIANTPYRAVAGEYSYEDSTDGDGKIQIYVPDDIQLLDVSIFAHRTYSDIYPNEMPLEWSVSLMQQLPEVSEVRGAAVRLNNLGYNVTVAREEDDLSLIEALAAFQRDHELRATGENDQETQDKLREVYGA